MFPLKFKYLTIAFCGIVVVILLTITLVPLLLIGPEAAATLRYITVPLFFFMVSILIFLGIFFLLNYRLFSLLEREDWPALAYYLEQKIYVKRRYSSRNVRLLASSYLVISDYASVLKLESKTMLAKHSIVGKNALIFGAARVLSGNYKDAVAFFKTYLEKNKGKDEDWLRWFYGFSLLLAGSFSQVEPEFMNLAVSSDSALITGLSAYFLSGVVLKHSFRPDECKKAAETGRARVVDALKNEAGWNKEVEKMVAEIHIAIIRKYVDEAGKWVFEKNPSREESHGDAAVKPASGGDSENL